MADQEGNRRGHGHACAACRHRKRKCEPNCELAKYFPSDNQAKFGRIHKRHGIKNVIYMLSRVPEDQRDVAVETIDKEAQIRIENPTHGCVWTIESLKYAIAVNESELEATNMQNSVFRAHTNPNTSTHHQQVLQQPYHQMTALQNVQGLDLSSSMMPATVARRSTVAGTSTHQQGCQQMDPQMAAFQNVQTMPDTVGGGSTVVGTFAYLGLHQSDHQMAAFQHVQGLDPSQMAPSSSANTQQRSSLDAEMEQLSSAYMQQRSSLDAAMEQLSSAYTRQRSSLAAAIEQLSAANTQQSSLLDAAIEQLSSANTQQQQRSSLVAIERLLFDESDFPQPPR